MGSVKESLMEVIRQRLIQRRLTELVTEVAEARNAYQRGEVCRGIVADLMKDLAEMKVTQK